MRHRRSFAAAVGLVAASALALSGCASEAPTADGATPSGNASGATDEFPLTIEHALGETSVEEAPVRVATWGWGSTEAAIAAGVYPVAVAEQTWTVGEGNLLPWVEDAYDEAGIEHPTVLTDAEAGASVPYEEFAAAEPDLIVAPYSGITQEQYDLLSEIAPTVAYPETPWQTPWDEIITATADALGRSAAGEAKVDEINQYLADEAEAHPEFAGKTFAAIVDSPEEGLIYVYRAGDPRAGFLEGLGLESAPAVEELAPDDGEFFYTLSYEELDKLESDIVVAYTYTEEEAEALPTKKELQALPAVKDGMVAQQIGTVAVSAVSPPTALSVQYPEGMPKLIDALTETLAE
ncbi:iron complex transport system substrate-binding protein [Promicromonospora umidemergens]|uniref:Iron-siderophore ABC transporter substrate-binding protein n=1 Tax=Promicromonospora umidemergens TaxID=629679 RepID=A0ABP8X7T3_9MICO|nr:iron-siderophore ABC transporter substrate-binding protein [Promicromonospora umidemergens]MCP2281361.1 iron complex transport system substrate-binding protein [Promicromonospora umidemergens]